MYEGVFYGRPASHSSHPPPVFLRNPGTLRVSCTANIVRLILKYHLRTGDMLTMATMNTMNTMVVYAGSAQRFRGWYSFNVVVAVLES